MHILRYSFFLFFSLGYVCWGGNFLFAYPQHRPESLDTSSLDFLENQSFSSPSAIPSAPTQGHPTELGSPPLPEVNHPTEETVPSQPSSALKNSGPSKESHTSLWELIRAGGWVGYLILILSLGAGALTIEHFLNIRTPVLMPEELTHQVGLLIAQDKLKTALETCEQNPCFFSSLVSSGLREVENGWKAVEKALEDTLADETARLFRKIEPLSLIGNIAPMLGLLGTVVGMVWAFGDLANSEGGLTPFADLARGIYFALITTVEGLIVAIPTLTLYAFFNNRIAGYVSASARQIEEIFRPLKKALLTSSIENKTPLDPFSFPSDHSSSPAPPPSSLKELGKRLLSLKEKNNK